MIFFCHNREGRRPVKKASYTKWKDIAAQKMRVRIFACSDIPFRIAGLFHRAVFGEPGDSVWSLWLGNEGLMRIGGND